jgi:myosin heavy subunit
MRVLGETSDYQIGITKIFLKDQDDQKLEEVREYQLTRRVIIIQKTFRYIIHHTTTQQHINIAHYIAIIERERET